MNRSRVPRRLLFLAAVATFSMNPLAAQGEGEDAITLTQQVRIFFSGIPLITISENAPASEAFGLRAFCLGDSSGTATGIHTEARANRPGGSSTMGIDVSSVATASEDPSGATAVGMRIDAGALNNGFGSFSGASATGLSVDASAFGPELVSCVGVSVTATGVAPTFPTLAGVRATAGGATYGHGVEGRITTPSGYGVFSDGAFGGTGAKYFLQPHPTDPARVIQFVCLEGNESGTYFRGTTRLVNGVAEIAIPEEWRLVTAADGITVQTTPIGSPSVLYVDELGRERIVVRGEPDCAFSYFVNGVRRGFEAYEPYRENLAFRPTVRGVPFGTQHPEALREILVQNGTLEPDFTPDEATAAMLGWRLQDPQEVRIQERWWLDPLERRRLLEEKRQRER